MKTITSTPFARFEIHKVKTESGAIINDWLWTDERSHVNILVHLKAENRYLLFHQKKYGLERPYYAAVGGLFDVGDTPMGCANRELLEETGLEAEMAYLGRYRVQVNRGGGILHAFYAKNAVPSKNKKASDDYEKQVTLQKKLFFFAVLFIYCRVYTNRIHVHSSICSAYIAMHQYNCYILGRSCLHCDC